jgi:hypothetical protein
MNIPYRFWKLNRVVAVVVAGLVMGLQANAFAVDASDFSIDASLRWEDNLSLSPAREDKVSDLTTHVSFAGNFGLVQTETNEFSIGVNAHYDHVSDTRDLSNYGAQLALLYKRNFGVDFNAPWLTLGADGQLLEYKDSDIRDGYIINTTLAIGRQLNPKVGISGGYRYFVRRNNFTNSTPMQNLWRSDEVFDLDRHNLFVRLDYAANEKTTIYGDLNYFDGDVAASGITFSNGGDFPRALDPAFGEGYKAWKIDATGYQAKLGMAHNFNEKLSLDAFVAYLSASGESNNDYDNTIIQALLSYQF